MNFNYFSPKKDNECALQGCTNPPLIGGKGCQFHSCLKIGCDKIRHAGDTFCVDHIDEVDYFELYVLVNQK